MESCWALPATAPALYRLPVYTPGGKPVIEDPGKTPMSPVMTVLPVLVTVEAPRTPNVAAVPRLTGTWVLFLRTRGVRTGGVRTGGVRTGGVRTGRVLMGGVRTGGVRTGGVRTGRVRARLRTGGVRTGRVRTGRVRTGRPRSGKVRTGRVRQRAMAERVMDWNFMLAVGDSEGLK